MRRARRETPHSSALDLAHAGLGLLAFALYALVIRAVTARGPDPMPAVALASVAWACFQWALSIAARRLRAHLVHRRAAELLRIVRPLRCVVETHREPRLALVRAPVGRARATNEP
ncbi:hypothetical protein [Sandaracinus amylolyticus]|uniref:hypothetical protein n=1 Tax=Sandaracinus amylolyticus TaxID=927083 RepID=UPI001F17843F|nr:hypothetical protein [Sandaracinus amylolyticus]